LKFSRAQSFAVAGLDYNLLKTSLETLKSGNIIDSTSITDNKVRIKLKSEYLNSEISQENTYDYILLTIPYEGKIIAKSDQEILETKRVFDSFLAIKIPQSGESIVLSFYPDEFQNSILLSIISFALGAALLIVLKSKNKHFAFYKNIVKFLYFLFIIFSITLLVVLYIVPIIISLF